MNKLSKSVEVEASRLEKEAARVMLEIHSYAEPAFQERKSAQVLANYLRQNGFEVDFAFRNLPTAFRATWGKGASIGILGEYDALPNCSRDGGWGHGCGHNLLGTAGALGAVITKNCLEKSKMKGRVVYYGCPAEETLSGKVYMARDNAFRDIDVCLGWHPGSENSIHTGGGDGTTDCDTIKYSALRR